MMRVLLIDDHALFRIGLLELLERRGIEVIDAVGDCDVGMRLARDCAPDVVLLDLRMPGAGGIEILKRMRAEGLDRRVAMLTTSTDEPDLIASLQAGANGYLLKDMEPDDLVAALEDIVAGKTVVAPTN
jgi:two-component system nitrate/nitrite response regulator NarL